MIDWLDPSVANGSILASSVLIVGAILRGGAAKLEAAAAVQRQIAESMARLTLLEKKCTDLEARLETKDAEIEELKQQIAGLKALPICAPTKCYELAQREAKLAFLEAKLKDWETRHPLEVVK